MVSPSAKKTLIITVSAIVGLTTFSTLAYLLIQDDKKAQHQRKIRSLQKSLQARLHNVDTAVEDLLQGDIRLAHVRTHTLHSRAIYPTGHSSSHEHNTHALPSHTDHTSTPEEVQREQSQGFDDPAKARQGYKRLDFLINSINERLLRLLEALDAISPRELTDLGNGFGGLADAAGHETVAFEKVRKRKRATIAKIQKIMSDMDKVGAIIKERVQAIEKFEVAEAEKKEEEEKQAKEAAELEKEARDAAELEEKLAKEEAAAKEKKEQEAKEHHSKHEEVLAHTEDLDKMKEGITFAEIAKHNTAHSEHHTEVLVHTEDLDKMKEGITFAEIAKHNIESHEQRHEQGQKQEEEETSLVSGGITETTESLVVIVNGEISSSATSSYANFHNVAESAVLVEAEEEGHGKEEVSVAEEPAVQESA
ncbi:hypothetical protein BG006_009516 [Podila minutissima]|uniref:Uncharacterized protein n=1 Tax=Podila minutissima TaxID=64525 RepID=A0A9P5SIH7_9FUNG|nr:hypothetical protein BG006_009516 [Podila minutissima]